MLLILFLLRCSKVVKKSNFSHKEILRDGNAFGQILKECLTTDKKHKCPESVSIL